jgi:alkylation response protein AidB-like acyl-CoA dehydrogenase
MRLHRDGVQHAPLRGRLLRCGPKAAGEQLRDVARGRHLTTLAFSERGSRSHFWAPVSRERAEGGRSVISAEKSWVTSAGEADGYVVSTQWASGKSPIESMLYLVCRATVGSRSTARGVASEWRGNSSSPMRTGRRSRRAGSARCLRG